MVYFKHFLGVLPLLIGLIIFSFISKNENVIYIGVVFSVILIFPNSISRFSLKWKDYVLQSINRIIIYFLLSIIYFCLLWPIALFQKIYNIKEQKNSDNHRTESTFLNRSYLYSQKDFKQLS